jgi:hypothetical protein
VAANKAEVIKETNTSAAMRTAGERGETVPGLGVGIDYRDDVYQASRFSKTNSS